jgi:hypothetical protein
MQEKLQEYSDIIFPRTEKEINKKKENKKRQYCLNVKQKADSYPVLPCAAVQTLIVHP